MLHSERLVNKIIQLSVKAHKRLNQRMQYIDAQLWKDQYTKPKKCGPLKVKKISKC